MNGIRIILRRIKCEIPHSNRQGGDGVRSGQGDNPALIAPPTHISAHAQSISITKAGEYKIAQTGHIKGIGDPGQGICHYIRPHIQIRSSIVNQG